MPELPEVETVRQGLLKHALRRRLAAVEVYHPQVIVGPAGEFAQNLAGRRIESVRRKGKVLALELVGKNGTAPCYLLGRLGMTGQLTVVPQGMPLEPHTHVRMPFERSGEEIRYRDVRRFGRLRCCTREQLERVFASLGPDAPDTTLEDFVRSMKERRGAVKGWLLNQGILSGLGNIYADEALFEAGIHPLAQPGRMAPAPARRLHRAVKKVLARAVALQGTSFRDYIDIEGRPGNFRPQLKVYQRTGQPCRRCGRAIRRIVVCGRSSHFCPNCQPRPRHAALKSKPVASRAIPKQRGNTGWRRPLGLRSRVTPGRNADLKVCAAGHIEWTHCNVDSESID
jgi:formamidopyrimidine-DNA glycosylase